MKRIFHLVIINNGKVEQFLKKKKKQQHDGDSKKFENM